MDVKAFIFEATDKALKIDEAVKGVDLAKEAVEAAKAAVEAAKAGVDTAKLAVVAAKEDLDAYAERAEEFGLTKAKFKDAVERMKVLLADIGAVDTAEASEPVEPKPRTPRKRKGQDATEAGQQPPQTTDEGSEPTDPDKDAARSDAGALTETAPPSEPSAFDPDMIMIGEIKDAASYKLAEEAARTGCIGFSQADEVDGAEEAESCDTTVTDETSATQEKPASAEISVEDELDNSFAEQELVDFVEELGSTDADVAKVLTAAVRVFSWHTTNVARKELRTSPSPLSLAGVLAVEGVGYLPADIKADYETAIAHGSEKLAAAISWFNKGIELLADAKEVADFRFSEPVKPARSPAAEPKPAVVEMAPAAQQEDAADADEAELGDLPDDGEETASIEDVDIFAADRPASEDKITTDEPSSEATVETPVATEEKAEPSFLTKPTKPAWLRRD